LSGILNIKFLWSGLFLAFLPVAAWTLLGETKPSPKAIEIPTLDSGQVKVPVEVIAKGGKAEWVMVEVSAQAIPEPGTFTLLVLLPSLLLLRRKREE
jgi:hypothetical protein